MSVDELKAGFSRLAADVVPMENPLGRLMARRKRRFRVRLAGLATATAAVIAVSFAAPSALINAASGPPDGTTDLQLSYAESPYLDKIVNAPLRGNLSQDTKYAADVEQTMLGTRQFTAERGLSRLVFLNKTKEMIQAVVVFRSREASFAVTAVAPADAPPAALRDVATGTYPLSPFLVVPFDFDASNRFVVGLAPPGCEISTSVNAVPAKDGSWIRHYAAEPTGDYVLRPAGAAIGELWRVSCDGRVREVRTADDNPGYPNDGDPTSMHQHLSVFAAIEPAVKSMVLWQGKVPDGSQATLVGAPVQPGPATLLVGRAGKTQLAIEPYPESVFPSPSMSKSDFPSPTMSKSLRTDTWAVASLGLTLPGGLIVVRVPARLGDNAVLTERLLVFTGPGYTKVETLDERDRVIASVPVVEQVSFLPLMAGRSVQLRAAGPKERVASPVRWVEPATGRRLLGDQLITDWS